MSETYPTFLGLDAESPSYEGADAVVLPLPFERTVSYGKGTALGPEALLAASAFVELYDEELRREDHSARIFTADPYDPEAEDLAEAMDAIRRQARRHMEAGKFLVSLGGEHSLTYPLAQAAQEVFGDGPDGRGVGVVQFDAHADLRDTYEGTKFSHAAVMRRVVDDLSMPSLAVGIRSLSSPEARLIDERQLPVIWSDQFHQDSMTGSMERFAAHLEALPQQIYLTFDLDFLDPSLLPGTGTPEPGGGTWHPTLAFLRHLFATKDVIAMDVVELAPQEHSTVSDFVAAKLTYKALGYRLCRPAS